MEGDEERCMMNRKKERRVNHEESPKQETITKKGKEHHLAKTKSLTNFSSPFPSPHFLIHNGRDTDRDIINRNTGVTTEHPFFLSYFRRLLLLSSFPLFSTYESYESFTKDYHHQHHHNRKGEE